MLETTTPLHEINISSLDRIMNTPPGDLNRQTIEEMCAIMRTMRARRLEAEKNPAPKVRKTKEPAAPKTSIAIDITEDAGF